MGIFVIAEAGISHCGKIGNAFAGIEAAKAAGADACKFQYFDAAKLAETRKKPELSESLKEYQMPKWWLKELKGKCDEVGVEFMATAFYEEGLEDLSPHVYRFKIGSAEAVNMDFVNKALSYKRPVIASDGMGGGYATHGNLSWLHCVSKYPCKMEDADVGGLNGKGSHSRVSTGMHLLHGGYRLFDGYSDHTRNVLTGALAVACGARILEVHFSPWNVEHPDTCVSLSPYELYQYIQNVKQAELALYGARQE